MGPGEYHKDRDPEGPAFTIPEARRGSLPAKETTVGPGEYHGCGLDTAGAAWTMGQKPKARVRCRRDPVPQERRPAAVPMHAVAEGGASAAAHGRTGISGCSGGGPRARACAACPRVRRDLPLAGARGYAWAPWRGVAAVLSLWQSGPASLPGSSRRLVPGSCGAPGRLRRGAAVPA